MNITDIGGQLGIKKCELRFFTGEQLRLTQLRLPVGQFLFQGGIMPMKQFRPLVVALDQHMLDQQLPA